jgi:catechol 2,3-dioxygenase-like lactoylglutathione lyase family enzyme
MIRVATLFHVTHMVVDMEAATAFYRDRLGATTYSLRYAEWEGRDACFNFLAELCLETVCPRVAELPAGRFVRRYGQDLHSLAWTIEGDFHEAVAFCQGKGYQVVVPLEGYFFVHPRDAFGIMLEISTAAVRRDPRVTPGWYERWRHEHPLGVLWTNATTFIVRDLDGAISFLQGLTEAPLLGRAAAEGRERAFLWVTDHAIELVRPLRDDVPEARYLQEKGPKIYSITFRVRDLERAARYLTGQGLHLLEHHRGHLLIDPAQSLGARLLFTEEAIPDDPRLSRS